MERQGKPYPTGWLKGGPVLASEDFQENPGTMALAASWVLIFALILLVQWQQGTPRPPDPKWEPLRISSVTGHRFGQMTWREVREGQYWRVLTATFVHFGLIHVALNTLGLISLGRLVEPWYRTGPFLAVCLVIGGLGNLVGGASRQVMAVARLWLASVAADRHWPGRIERFLRGGTTFPDLVPTGGGSTILLGLLALAAVVGWRSRTRIGVHLQRQMIFLLALTAVLGLMMTGLVDNYGHLGGAIVGAGIGLFDRPLMRLSESRWFRAWCWAFALGLSTACLGSAIRADRLESSYQHEFSEIARRGRVADSVHRSLKQLHYLYAMEATRSDSVRVHTSPFDSLAIADLLSKGPRTGDQTPLLGVLDRLDHIMGVPWGDEIARDIRRLLDLARSSVTAPPTFDQVYEFVVCWRSAEKAVAADMVQLNARFAELEATRKHGR
jgi:membrane associated rhomboid family serine protease